MEYSKSTEASSSSPKPSGRKSNLVEDFHPSRSRYIKTSAFYSRKPLELSDLIFTPPTERAPRTTGSSARKGKGAKQRQLDRHRAFINEGFQQELDEYLAAKYSFPKDLLQQVHDHIQAERKLRESNRNFTATEVQHAVAEDILVSMTDSTPFEARREPDVPVVVDVPLPDLAMCEISEPPVIGLAVSEDLETHSIEILLKPDEEERVDSDVSAEAPLELLVRSRRTFRVLGVTWQDRLIEDPPRLCIRSRDVATFIPRLSTAWSPPYEHPAQEVYANASWQEIISDVQCDLRFRGRPPYVEFDGPSDWIYPKFGPNPDWDWFTKHPLLLEHHGQFVVGNSLQIVVSVGRIHLRIRIPHDSPPIRKIFRRLMSLLSYFGLSFDTGGTISSSSSDTT